MEPVIIENKNNGSAPAMPPVFSDRSAFSAAYERRLAEIRAVPDDALIAMNLDVHASVTTVLGALPEILALRKEMAKLPNLNQALVDGLEDYTEAAAEANSRYVTATAPEEDIIALNAEAMKLRETLHSDAVALANRRLIDPSKLKSFQGLVGYKNVGFDVIDWANIMRDAWPTIKGKTALTAEEVQRAKDVGERLVRAAGLREQGPAVLAEVARIRQQVLTLLVKSYDEVRRAISFLRWKEDDVETIAPSLYGGRTRKQPSTDANNAPATPASGNADAQVASAAPVGGANNPHAAAPSVAQAAASGLPGANPFDVR